MRGAAMAYYASEQQFQVWNLYKQLDSDGDGTVKVQDYSDFLKDKDYAKKVPRNLFMNMFSMLNKNGDGTLDFEDCITLYYMIEGRGIWCCVMLWGINFIRVKCYEAGGGTTYELSRGCFQNRNFKHQHSVFLDNFTLLRYKQPSPPSPTQRNTSRQGQCSQTNSKKEQIKEAHERFQMGHDVEATGAAESSFGK
ncbi:unnamed protein product [Camellia sinensis]